MDKNVLVCVDKQCERNIDEISSDLSRAGLKVMDVLKISGIVTGSVDNSKIPELKRIRGVASVDLDREFTAQ